MTQPAMLQKLAQGRHRGPHSSIGRLQALPSQGQRARIGGLRERPVPSGHRSSPGLWLAGRHPGATIPMVPATSRATPSQKVDQPTSQGAQATPQTPAGGGGPGGSRSTWKCRMIVQMRPRVSLGLPSAMSSFLIFTSFTCERGALGHGPQGRAGLVRGWLGPGPGGQPYLAVPEVVQGNLDVLQLVETHSPLLPGLWGGSVSTHSAAAAPRPHPQHPLSTAATEPRVFPGGSSPSHPRFTLPRREREATGPGAGPGPPGLGKSSDPD